MRNNKVLMAAVATALSVNSDVLLAQETLASCMAKSTSAQFENVTDGESEGNCVARVAGEVGLFVSGTGTIGKRLPAQVFDFTAGQSVLATAKATEGITFAAEMFGGSNIVLPTVASSGNTADYMGVVYTIDGYIPVDFDVSFTLDNGATFAENPILGVRDKKGDGLALLPIGATVSLAATSMPLDSSGISADTIFRFYNHDSIYYSEAGGAAPTFYLLGDRSDGVKTAVATTDSTDKNRNIYGVSGKGTTPVRVSPVNTVKTALAGTTTKTLTVNSSTTKDVALLITNGYYTCSTTSASAGSTKLFTINSVASGVVTVGEVSSTPTVTSPLGTSVAAAKNLYISGASNNNYSAGSLTPGTDCIVGDSIYRIHVPGDTLIFLENGVVNFSKDNVYQFNTNADYPQTDQYKVTALDGTNNMITIQNVSGRTGLANALVGGEKAYDIQIGLDDQWTSSGQMTPKPPMFSSASGKNVASFVMNAGKSDETVLEQGDQLMLLYKLSNVGILADPTQKINMTVDLKTGGAVDTLVNPRRTVTVAKSAKALDVSLVSLDDVKLNIAVSSGNTKFIGTAPVSYINDTTAAIGRFKIKSNSTTAKPIATTDGFTEFKISSSAVMADKSKLVITGGQFAASNSNPGKVQLDLGSTTIAANQITMDSAGEWSAIWNLTTSQLSSISDPVNNTKVDANGDPSALIEIKVDGVTEINSVENAPLGVLTIDFDNSSYQDISTDEVELRKISKDGNVCTVYAVPPPAKGVRGADVINIRITNDSSVSGKLLGKLYSKDGGEPIWTGDLMAEELRPQATVRITSDELATLSGVTWDGRAVLKISSTIPNMEVMALIRQNGLPFAPLSNLSTGARGTSCSQD